MLAARLPFAAKRASCRIRPGTAWLLLGIHVSALLHPDAAKHAQLAVRGMCCTSYAVCARGGAELRHRAGTSRWQEA
eukprot:348423-Prorocentrum_lima.AAC.1